MAVEVRGGEVWVDGERLHLEHGIRAAEQLHDGNVVVLYEPDAGSIPSWKRFNNLVSVDAHGNVRWTAPLPDTSADVYVDLVSVEPLVARSYSGFPCTLSPDTSEIIDRQFVK